MKNYALQNRQELEKSNYVRVASPDTSYWVDFRPSKLKEYEARFGDNFNLIIIGDENIEGDFYTIPYWLVKTVFTEQNLYTATRRRWIASINFHQLNVRKFHEFIDVGQYYGVLERSNSSSAESSEINEQQADYSIENRKLEIKARQKQSVFRTRVLNNFGHCCCLSDTSEEDLLIASHIIPWAERIQTRLDPSNGLCLSYVYDKLFDEGYFSLRDDFRVMVTRKAPELSQGIQTILETIEGQKIREPRLYPVSLDYLEYHRQNKLKK
ncbi:MAG: HNH endonuclease [Anaerolineales bacterium]